MVYGGMPERRSRMMDDIDEGGAASCGAGRTAPVGAARGIDTPGQATEKTGGWTPRSTARSRTSKYASNMMGAKILKNRRSAAKEIPHACTRCRPCATHVKVSRVHTAHTSSTPLLLSLLTHHIIYAATGAREPPLASPQHSTTTQRHHTSPQHTGMPIARIPLRTHSLRGARATYSDRPPARPSPRETRGGRPHALGTLLARITGRALPCHPWPARASRHADSCCQIRVATSPL